MNQKILEVIEFLNSRDIESKASVDQMIEECSKAGFSVVLIIEGIRKSTKLLIQRPSGWLHGIQFGGQLDRNGKFYTMNWKLCCLKKKCHAISAPPGLWMARTSRLLSDRTRGLSLILTACGWKTWDWHPIHRGWGREPWEQYQAGDMAAAVVERKKLPGKNDFIHAVPGSP